MASSGSPANAEPSRASLSLSFRPGARRVWHHRLAGLDLICDRPLAELHSTAADAPAAVPQTTLEPRAGRQVFCDLAWVAGGQEQLAVWWHGDHCWIELEDQVTLALDRASGSLWVIEPRPDLDPKWLEHALLGPALLLGLASRGVFALHASAIELDGALALFVGPSGAGKSTLAAEAGTNCRRWADDLVPVQLEHGQVVAWPDYPQLKLAAGERLQDSSTPTPVSAVLVLEPAPPKAATRCTRWAGLEATTAWLSHTMVSRLFDPALLEAHLDFVTLASQAVPTYRLRVPRDRQRLPEVTELLRQTLEPAGTPST